MPNKNGQLTNRELLVRIDERQRAIIKHLELIDLQLENKVDCKDFEPYEKKINTMWDDRNKVLGMVALSSLGGGTVVYVIGKIITNIMAYAFGG